MGQHTNSGPELQPDMGRKKSLLQSEQVTTDLKSLGYDFRINDLDDGLEFRRSVSKGVQWRRLTDVFEAVIRYKNVFSDGDGWARSDIIYRGERLPLYPDPL